MKTIKELVLILITAVVMSLIFVVCQSLIATFQVEIIRNYQSINFRFIGYFLGVLGSIGAAFMILPITTFSFQNKYFPILSSVFCIFFLMFIQQDITYSNRVEYVALIIFSLAFGYVGNRLRRK